MSSWFTSFFSRPAETPPPSTEQPGPEYFNASNGTYFGPHFIVNPPNDNNRDSNEEGGSQPHFLDPRNILWSDIWSTVASGKQMNESQLKEFGNPYYNHTQNDAQTTSTLQALVNLKKNTLKLNKTADGKYQLEFHYDASTPCMIRLFLQVKEVVVVDSQTGAPKGMKNVIFRASDNSAPKLKSFGPFPPGLNQTFTIPETDLLNAVDFYGKDLDENGVDDSVNATEEAPPNVEAVLELQDKNEAILNEDEISESGNKQSNQQTLPKKTQNQQQKKALPYVFSMIIVLETLVPALTDGLEKASMQGMTNPMNSQSTYISMSPSHKEGLFDVKIQKQRIMIDNVSYLLQEIYGFLDDENDTSTSVSEPNSNRDCVICMSDPRDTIVLPCRHLCLCKDCAEVLRSQGRRLPASATVGGSPPTTNDANGGASNTANQNGAAPAAGGAAQTALGSLFGPAPPPPSRSTMGPPKCPICRQVFHSLLQINLPKPAQPHSDAAHHYVEAE